MLRFMCEVPFIYHDRKHSCLIRRQNCVSSVIVSCAWKFFEFLFTRYMKRLRQQQEICVIMKYFVHSMEIANEESHSYDSGSAKSSYDLFVRPRREVGPGGRHVRTQRPRKLHSQRLTPWFYVVFLPKSNEQHPEIIGHSRCWFITKLHIL